MPLTNDLSITKDWYWDDLIAGRRMNAAVDSSNSKKVTGFDRFTIVVDLVEGPNVMEAAAGHARISSMVKAKNPTWHIAASDQSEEGRKASNFHPYSIYSVYSIPVTDKFFNTVIATQCWEYFEFPDRAITEFKRIAHKGVFTFPNGEMALWSQLRIYTPSIVKEFLEQYGEIEVLTEFEHIILAKIKFK